MIHNDRRDGRGLTRRHVQILQCLAKGLTSEEAARKLGIQAKTVEAHRAGLLVRMEALNAPHAVYLGMKRGLIK